MEETEQVVGMKYLVQLTNLQLGKKPVKPINLSWPQNSCLVEATNLRY